MKFLFVIDSLGSGGSQRQMINLAVALKKRGNEVSFLVYHPNIFYADELRKFEIRVNQINEQNYFLRLIKMRKRIRASNADVVLSFLEAPNFICEVAGLPWRKWKLIVSERSANPEALKSIKAKIMKQFHVLADFVITNTHANRNLIRKIVPFLRQSKLRVIYNFVDLDTFKPIKDYSYKRNGKLHLLIASSHQYLKNLNGLVEGLALLDNQMREKIKIIWYGDRRDDSLEVAKRKIEYLGLSDNFDFYPAVREINLAMQQADVLGIFSFHEGFPNAICEAMACGKPVISSEIGDLPMHIKVEQMLFMPDDPRSIADVLKYILNLSEEELCAIGKTNFNYASKNFSENRIVNEYLQILRQA